MSQSVNNFFESLVNGSNPHYAGTPTVVTPPHSHTETLLMSYGNIDFSTATYNPANGVYTPAGQ